MIEDIAAFFDRNWNRLFQPDKCFKLILYNDFFSWNDILSTDEQDLRCMGNGWYKIQDKNI